jgi:hypothetical protein
MKKQNKTGNLTFLTLLKKKSFLGGMGEGLVLVGNLLTGHNNFHTKKSIKIQVENEIRVL